jgi:hypothetical protein
MTASFGVFVWPDELVACSMHTFRRDSGESSL